MKLVRLIDFLRNRLKTVICLGLAALLVLVLLDALPGLVDKERAHTRWEQLPAFWAVFGFVGCVVIVLVSKWYGHRGIMTREDYYDE
jgi:hypothetical protein